MIEGRRKGTEKIETTSKRYKIVCKKRTEKVDHNTLGNDLNYKKRDGNYEKVNACSLGPHWLEKLENQLNVSFNFLFLIKLFDKVSLFSKLIKI